MWLAEHTDKVPSRERPRVLLHLFGWCARLALVLTPLLRISLPPRAQTQRHKWQTALQQRHLHAIQTFAVKSLSKTTNPAVSCLSSILLRISLVPGGFKLISFSFVLRHPSQLGC